jgi:hypothetical protein
MKDMSKKRSLLIVLCILAFISAMIVVMSQISDNPNSTQASPSSDNSVTYHLGSRIFSSSSSDYYFHGIQFNAGSYDLLIGHGTFYSMSNIVISSVLCDYRNGIISSFYLENQHFEIVKCNSDTLILRKLNP